MTKDDSIFDMTAEAFAEKHPEDVKAWQTQAAEKATTVAEDVERQRFAALETAFPDHPAFVAEQFKAGSIVEEAKVAHNAVVQAELVVERKARLEAEEKLKTAANAVPFVASDVDADTPADDGKVPKTFMAAITAYSAEHKDVDLKTATRACAVAYPELYEKQRTGKE